MSCRGNHNTSFNAVIISEPIFAEPADYAFYLEKFKVACEQQACVIHAYVLMTNHVHLLITPTSKAGIGKVMQRLGRYYVQYFNYVYDRTGTLWQGRYKATLLINSEDYLLTCMRYLELNPVRAAMVDHPAAYPYCSYAANARGATDPLVTPHSVYRRLGQTPKARQAAYRSLFRTQLSADTVSAIRESTNKAWVLGSDRFKVKIQKLTKRQASPNPRGGDRKSRAYRPINRV